MLDNRFSICIMIENLGTSISEEKEIYYYLASNGQKYFDTITFTENQIVIQGSRTKGINPIDAFYTIQSTFYRETVNALLYVYYKYGAFNLQTISFTAGGEKVNIGLMEGKNVFSHPYDGRINPSVLEHLFDIDDKASVLSRVLQFRLLAKGGSRVHFDYSWRAVNALYNWKFPETKAKDTESVKKLLAYIKENPESFGETQEVAGAFFASDFPWSRVFRMMGERIDYTNRNYGSELSTFETNYLSESYTDSRVLELVKEFWESAFNKNRELISKVDRETWRRFKSIAKKIESLEEEETSFDLVRFIVWLIYYSRNKQFHGEIWPSDLLISNRLGEELRRFTEILMILVDELINEMLN